MQEDGWHLAVSGLQARPSVQKVASLIQSWTQVRLMARQRSVSLHWICWQDVALVQILSSLQYSRAAQSVEVVQLVAEQEPCGFLGVL